MRSGSTEGLQHLASCEWLNGSDVRCVLSRGTCENVAGLDELLEEGPYGRADLSRRSAEQRDKVLSFPPHPAKPSPHKHDVSLKTSSVFLTVEVSHIYQMLLSLGSQWYKNTS